MTESDYNWQDIDWGNEEDKDTVDPYNYVLGMDPGGTTGIALIRYMEDSLPQLVYLHQIEGGLEGFYKWFEFSFPGSNLTIVSEKWKERNVKGADRTPQYIEGLQYGWWRSAIKFGEDTEGAPGSVFYQFPEIKELVPDDFLRAQNLWTQGKRHQMDALKHAIAFLRNKGHLPTVKVMSGEGGGEPDENGNEEQLIAQPEEAQQKQLGDGDGQNFEEAMKEAQEAVKGDSDGDGESGDDGEAGGGNADGSGDESDGDPSGSGGMGVAGGAADFSVKGERKRRERNGVFAGYDPDGDETVLYDFK